MRFVVTFLLILELFFIPFSDISASDRKHDRLKMIKQDLIHRDIRSPLVLKAFEIVERHRFVPANVQEYAYEDRPLPIGEGQTISQPYMVALMSQLLDLKVGTRVLEIGTGSGYQAAILQAMGAEVYSIEIIPALANRTTKLFESLNLPVKIKNADGYFGWKESAPFDRIIITAAANHIPRPLIDQLLPDGKLILPLGNTRFFQTLTLVTLDKKGKTRIEYHGAVRFVPMTGKMLR